MADDWGPDPDCPICGGDGLWSDEERENGPAKPH